MKSLEHLKELFKRYNPNKHNDEVGMELKILSKGARCVVFKDEKCLVDISAQFLHDLPQLGERFRYYYNKDEVLDVLRIGDIPNKTLWDNPIYVKKSLNPDSTCSVTGFYWNDISKSIKQFLWLGTRDVGEVKSKDATYIQELISDRNGFERLKTRYNKTWLLYQKLSKAGQLPTMRSI